MEQAVCHNENFRTAFWTGCHLRLTLRCTPSGGEIGLELHPDTDQFLRLESEAALVKNIRAEPFLLSKLQNA